MARIKYGGWYEADTTVFGDISAAGSGALDFITEAAQNVEVFSLRPPESIEHAVQTNVTLICKLLSRERASLHTVRKFWGAGFEMVYLSHDTFTKFDDITYIINQGIFSANGDLEIPIPSIILRYKYFGDVLTITAITPFSGETEEKDSTIIVRYKDFKVRQFIVEPINHTDETDFSQLAADTSFVSYQNAMGYILETPTGLYMPASFNTGHELVVDYTHLSSVTITMHREINDKLVHEAKKVFEQLHKGSAPKTV